MASNYPRPPSGLPPFARQQQQQRSRSRGVPSPQFGVYGGVPHPMQQRVFYNQQIRSPPFINDTAPRANRAFTPARREITGKWLKFVIGETLDANAGNSCIQQLVADISKKNTNAPISTTPVETIADDTIGDVIRVCREKIGKSFSTIDFVIVVQEEDYDRTDTCDQLRRQLSRNMPYFVTDEQALQMADTDTDQMEKLCAKFGKLLATIGPYRNLMKHQNEGKTLTNHELELLCHCLDINADQNTKPDLSSLVRAVVNGTLVSRLTSRKAADYDFDRQLLQVVHAVTHWLPEFVPTIVKDFLTDVLASGFIDSFVDAYVPKLECCLSEQSLEQAQQESVHIERLASVIRVALETQSDRNAVLKVLSGAVSQLRMLRVSRKNTKRNTHFWTPELQKALSDLDRIWKQRHGSNTEEQ